MLTQTATSGSSAHDRLLIIGHRGAAGLRPENTLAGFAYAVELGVDAVELDVQMSGDQHLVVMHDERVERTTDGTGPVAEMALATLRCLDAGNGERVPTLEEVLDAIPARVGVHVELKGPGTAAPVARLAAARVRPMLVSSFDHGELASFRRLCPTVPCAPLLGRWRDDVRTTAVSLDAWSVNLADRIATRDRVAAVRSWGYRCLVYTVNSPMRARKLFAMGVAGIFTDFPDRFLD